MFHRKLRTRSARKLLLQLTRLYKERLLYLQSFDTTDEFLHAQPSNADEHVTDFMRGDFLTEVAATLAVIEAVESRIRPLKSKTELAGELQGLRVFAQKIDLLNHLFVRYLLGPGVWLGGPSEEELRTGVCKKEILFTPTSIIGQHSSYRGMPYLQFARTRDDLLRTIRQHPVFST